MSTFGTWKPSVAIVGAGAIGCRIAAHLAAAGTRATLFDGWRAHVDALRASGLVFEGHGQGPAQHHALEAFYSDAIPSGVGRFDLVLLCTRSDETPAMLAVVERLLSADGCVVSCQNGINEEAIAQAVGAQRTLGCSLVFGARLTAPGQVVALPGEDTLRTGEMQGGETARLAAIVHLLSACGTSSATPNLMGYRWMKLVLNSIGNPLLLLSGMTAAQLHALPAAREAMRHLAREVIRAGQADGVRFEPVLGLAAADWLEPSPDGAARVHQALAAHGAGLGARRLSMVADFEARGKTEVDYINGHVVRVAARHGLAAPLNARVVQLVYALEAGHLRAGPAVIGQLATTPYQETNPETIP